jgi:DNA-binding MarR family transcriptional regulator
MNEEQPYSFHEPAKRAPEGSRLAELTRLLDELEEQPEILSGDFNALAMMIADAALDADDATLTAAQDGLQRLYGLQAWIDEPSPEQLEARGRVLGLIDLLQWTLRRVVPKTLLTRLEPNGHAHSFLQAIADRPGLSNQQLTEQLQTDETEISRVGRRLLENGLARKRKLGRRNQWEITPRGEQALEVDAPDLDARVLG